MPRRIVQFSKLNHLFSAGVLVLALALATLAQTAGDAVKEAQRLTRVAQTAEAQNRNDDAIKAYETIALIAKSSPAIASSALVNAGGLYMRTGRFDKAANTFRAAVAANPGSAVAQNNLGEALGEMNQYQGALRAFQQAVNLDSSFVRARYNMGVTYERLGQMKYAEFVYKIVIREHPDFPLAYDSLGVTLSKSGRPREAIAYHQKAIMLNPGDPTFHYNAAVSYLMLGDIRNAQEQKRQVEKMDPAMAEHLAVMIAKRQN
jgi:tetratricopeptide (TPR) repeat protein